MVNNAAVLNPNQEPTCCCCCLEEPRPFVNPSTNQKGKRFSLQPRREISPVPNPCAHPRLAPSPGLRRTAPLSPHPLGKG